MNLPGTCPPKVQNVYSTPLARRMTCSRTSSSTTSSRGERRESEGGTAGASVGVRKDVFSSLPSPVRRQELVPPVNKNKRRPHIRIAERFIGRIQLFTSVRGAA